MFTLLIGFSIGFALCFALNLECAESKKMTKDIQDILDDFDKEPRDV